MKIYFRKTKDGKWAAMRSILGHMDVSDTTFEGNLVPAFSAKHKEAICDLLWNNFKNITLFEGENETGIEAVFSDEADEAHFILWSSSGIDISLDKWQD